MDNNVDSNILAERRRILAESIRNGDVVNVEPSGAVMTKDEAQDQGLSGIQVPDGKLA